VQRAGNTDTMRAAMRVRAAPAERGHMDDSDRIVAAIYAATMCQAEGRRNSADFLACYDELIAKLKARAQQDHWEKIPG